MCRKLKILLWGLFALIAVVITVDSVKIKVNAINDEESSSFADKWTIYIEGEPDPGEIDLPMILDGSYKDKTLVLLNRLKNSSYMNPAILLRTSQQSVKVFINNKLEYSYDAALSKRNFDFLGSLYHIVEYDKKLEADDSIIRIELSSPTKYYSGFLNDILIGTKTVHIASIIKNELPSVILCIFTLGIGLVLLLFYILNRKNSHTKTFLLNFGLVQLTAGVWICTLLKSIQFIIPNPVVVMNISLICFFAFPLLFSSFISKQYHLKPHLISKVITFIFPLIYIITGILSFFKIKFLSDYPQLYMLLLIIYIIDTTVNSFVHYKKGNVEIKNFVFGIQIVATCIVIDALFFIFSPNMKNFYIVQAGFLFLSVFLIFTTLKGVADKESSESKSELSIIQERYKIISKNFSDVLFDWNIKDNTVCWDKKYEDYFGKKPITENFPKLLFKSSDLTPECIDNIKKMYENILSGSEYEEIEGSFINNKSEVKWFKVAVSIIFDNNKNPVRAVGIITDITENKLLKSALINKEIEMKTKLQKDPLTGLYNKVATKELIDDYLSHNKTSESIHAFLMIDIDNFKSINDCLGHAFGDEVISELSDNLKSLLRSTDIVGRIGGDEFCVFMKDIPNRDIVHHKSAEICSVFKNFYGNSNITCPVSSSIGICIAPEHGTTFDELYKNADLALYASKHRGKNTFVFYSPEHCLDSFSSQKFGYY